MNSLLQRACENLQAMQMVLLNQLIRSKQQENALECARIHVKLGQLNVLWAEYTHLNRFPREIRIQELESFNQHLGALLS